MISKETIERIRGFSTLIPYYELQQGSIIPETVLSNRWILFRMHEMARAICEEKQYGALAFTQIPPEVFERFNLNPKYSRCIYFAEGNGLLNKLLINPSVEHTEGQQVRIEGCGSIDDGQIYMVMRRYKKMVFSGYVYNPEDECMPITHKVLCVEGVDAVLFDHEYEHLEGRSAIDRPDDIIDFLRFDNWSGLDDLYRSQGWTVTSQIDRHATTFGKNEWLIYREGKLLKYSYNTGTFVKYLDNK